MQSTLKRLWDSPTFTTWGNYSAKALNIVLLSPIIVSFLSVTETALWFVFLIYIDLQNIANSGFNSTFIRLTGFAMGGCKSLDLKDEEKKDLDAEPNWDLINEIDSTVRIMYLGLSIVFFILLSTIGTYYIIPSIDQTEHINNNYIAWIIVVVTTTINIYGFRYTIFLNGTGKVALLMRWEAIYAAVSIILTSIFLVITKNLLVAVAIYQFFVILRVIRNVYLAKNIYGGAYRQFVNKGFSKHVFKASFQSSLRTWVAQIMSYGIVQFTGIYYSSFGDRDSVAGYLFSLKLLYQISNFANAPLYSQVPQYNRLFAQKQFGVLKQALIKNIGITLFLFPVLCIMVGESLPILLDLIKSNTGFIGREIWILMTLGFFTNRVGAVLLISYQISNKVYAHIANGVSGLIYIILLIVMNQYNVEALIAFPLGYLISNLMFYSWFPIILTRKLFGFRVIDYVKVMGIPILILLAYYLFGVFQG